MTSAPTGCLLLAAFWFATSLRGADAQPTPPRAPAQVAIVGNDYTFLQPPTTLPGGETLFAFENRGKVRHELSIALLKPGVGVQDVMNQYAQGGRRRDLFETSIGVLLAFPSDTAGGRLLAKLIPGRSYSLLCSLRDAPDAQQHVMLGMVSVFTVPKTP